MSELVEIGANTHTPVKDDNNEYIIQDDTILIQDNETGSVMYVLLCDETRKILQLEMQEEVNAEPSAEHYQQEDEENEVSEEDEDNNGGLKLWTSPRTLFLITQIENSSGLFEGGIKKNIWEKICKACCIKFQMNHLKPKQCEGKWKSLKRTYKSILLHNQTSGKQRRRWEFFSVIDKFMNKRPEIHPVATCSNLGGLKTKLNSLKSSQGEAGPSSRDDSKVVEETFESSFTKKRRVRTSGVAVRHTEKMARLDTFNDLFATMIDKM